jgi:hypothetical protein
MSWPRMLYPHDYAVLWHLALAETDETATGGNGREGNTVRELYPANYPTEAARRQRAGTSLRSLERLGLVERAGTRAGLVVWQTTATGYELVFR